MYLAAVLSGLLVSAFTLSQRVSSVAALWAPVLALGLVIWLASKLSKRAFHVLQVVVVIATTVGVGVEPTSTVALYATALLAAVFGVHWHRRRHKKGSGKSKSRRRR